MHAALLSLAFAFAFAPPPGPELTSEPAPAPAGEPVSSPDPAPPDPEFQATVDKLHGATLAASNDVDLETLAALTKLIEAAAGFELGLTRDPRARRRLLFARLTLARGYFITGELTLAEQTLDGLLRSVPDPSIIPIVRFQSIVPLFEARRAALDNQGQARIEILCHTECDATINGHPIEAGEHDLYLATYSVALSTPNDDATAEITTVVLVQPGQVEVVEFDASAPPQPSIAALLEPRPAAPAPSPPPMEPTPEPVGPRFQRPTLGWAGVSGLIVGVGLVAGGATAWSYDGQCVNGLDDPRYCPRLYESTAVGATTVSIGSAFILTSSVLLAVGFRGRAAPRSKTRDTARKRAALVWTGAVGLAAGAGLAVGGAAALSYDGQCTADANSPTPCRNLYESTVAGATLVSVGSAFVVTSTALLILGLRRHKDRAASFRVDAGGVLHF